LDYQTAILAACVVMSLLGTVENSINSSPRFS
jgi:hypothetical protein